jgi:DNA end-binding protein Ku
MSRDVSTSPDMTRTLTRDSPLRREIIIVMRAIWKGSISFGLVNIPIALYPATKKEDLSFRLLRKTDLSPVNYKRVAEKDGKEVPWDHIVKGYEYEKGKYVVLKDEDFQRVDLEATQTVDIQDFVDLDEIDPIFSTGRTT